MTILTLGSIKGLKWTGTCFSVPGQSVKFDTTYEILNPKSERSVEFNFKESTGSEWDPTTIWVYETADKKYQLLVGNDDVTEAHAQAYLAAKTV